MAPKAVGTPIIRLFARQPRGIAAACVLPKELLYDDKPSTKPARSCLARNSQAPNPGSVRGCVLEKCHPWYLDRNSLNYRPGCSTALLQAQCTTLSISPMRRVRDRGLALNGRESFKAGISPERRFWHPMQAERSSASNFITGLMTR
jgi:hypothetical protein